MSNDNIIQELENNLQNETGANSAYSAGFNDGINKAINLIEQHGGGWISVDDETPTEYGKYWVYNASSDKCYKCVWNNTSWAYQGKQITHWQPLPEPPKPTDHE